MMRAHHIINKHARSDANNANAVTTLVTTGSDSVDSGVREMDLWFAETEVMGYEPALKSWIYE
jgi:nucleoside diphosphate kinase